MPSKKLTRYPAVELLRFFDPEMSSSDIGDALGITGDAVRGWKKKQSLLSAFEGGCGAWLEEEAVVVVGV